MKNRIGIVLIAVLLLISTLAAGCGEIGATTPVTAVTNASTPTPLTAVITTATDFTSVNAVAKKFANGLSLSISINPQLIKPGYPIHIVITESNMLSKTNNLRVSDKWPIKELSDGICGTEGYPFGIAVFQGDYTAANILISTPLILNNPNVIVQGCVPPVFNVTVYHFKSTSDIATLDGEAINGSATFEMSTEVIGGIDWVGSFPNAVQQYFEPGVYTVVGGDEWGKMVILHFTVTN